MVASGRIKKFYFINWSFFGVFGAYPCLFGFIFKHDTVLSAIKVVYFHQSKVLVSIWSGILTVFIF